MSFEIGTATDVGDLMTKLNAFLQLGHSLYPIHTGTGTCALVGCIGTAVSVLETITVTFGSGGTFAVVGDVTGALGSGVVGTPFTSSVVNFTITGSPVEGDTLAFVMTPKWTTNRAIEVGTGLDEYLWTAPGNDGTSEIYVGMKRFRNLTGDYDNLRLLGATGFDTNQPFTNQPLGFTRPCVPLLRVGSMPYWFVADGRRVVGVVKCSTDYEAFYLGFMQPYQNPAQYQYPLVVGGSLSFLTEPADTSVNWRWSYEGDEHKVCPMSGAAPAGYYYSDNQSLRYRNPNGTWVGAITLSYDRSNSPIGYIWPYWGMKDMRTNLDGSYPLFPVVLHEDFQHLYQASQIDGELEGLYATTGYGQAAEDIITVDEVQYIVFQNAFRTTIGDYFALRLA